MAESPVHGRMVARIAHEDVEAPWQLRGIHLKQIERRNMLHPNGCWQLRPAAGIKRPNLRRQRGEKWQAIEKSLLSPEVVDLDDLLTDWLPE